MDKGHDVQELRAEVIKCAIRARRKRIAAGDTGRLILGPASTEERTMYDAVDRLLAAEKVSGAT